jgi:hypothetical protein
VQGPLINSALFFQICSVLCVLLLLPCSEKKFIRYAGRPPRDSDPVLVTHASSPESNLAARSFLTWSEFPFPRGRGVNLFLLKVKFFHPEDFVSSRAALISPCL